MNSKRFRYGAVAGAFCVVLIMPVLLTSGSTSAVGEITEPVEFVWKDRGDHWYGVLEYGSHTFDIGGETLTTRAYRQEGGTFTIPGPTIRMTAGEKYVLRFENLLDYEAPAQVHNDFKDPNITNVHTHGLHISGMSPGDDVLRMFEGGRGGDYVWDIPIDHMGGTFWYHAHHHGATYLQVSTGGFGLMVIDNPDDGIPANVAAMGERQVVIGYLDTNAAGIGGDSLVSGTLPAGWTVNGVRNGTLTVPPDTWEHWRVLLADADARSKNLVVGGNCETMLLARDGVWRTTAPKALPDGTIGLTGASRADLAVRCGAGGGTIQVGNAVVASVAVAGTADPGPHPFDADGVSTWSAVRPGYLRDLRELGNGDVNVEKISMGARTINGTKFDADTPLFTFTADKVQHWNVQGATNHPFHLHIYHFQVQADCGDFEGGEWYDTVAGNCSIRFDMSTETSSPYEGVTIMHCHVLDHEDQGAMTWMNVVGGTPPPTYPAWSPAYSEYFVVGGEPPSEPPAAPSGLSATATSSFAIELLWTDNSGDETGFDVERSLDGVDFSPLTSPGAGVTTYVDVGLSAGTTYWYRVRATNAAGSSAWSNIASATTLDDPGGPTSISTPTVTVTTVNAGKGAKSGQATVTVVDDLGNPVPGATVTGDFSGTFAEPGVSGAPTDADGVTTITTSGSAKGGVTVTFCVTSITHGTLAGWTDGVCAST